MLEPSLGTAPGCLEVDELEEDEDDDEVLLVDELLEVNMRAGTPGALGPGLGCGTGEGCAGGGLAAACLKSSISLSVRTCAGASIGMLAVMVSFGGCSSKRTTSFT